MSEVDKKIDRKITKHQKDCPAVEEIKSMHEKLEGLSYLTEDDFKNSLINIVKGREADEIIKRRWTGRLKFIGLIITVISGVVGLIYGLSKFIKWVLGY